MALILESLNNTVLGPVFALLAGILASASPCAMAAIPIITGQMCIRDRASGKYDEIYEKYFGTR